MYWKRTDFTKAIRNVWWGCTSVLTFLCGHVRSCPLVFWALHEEQRSMTLLTRSHCSCCVGNWIMQGHLLPCRIFSRLIFPKICPWIGSGSKWLKSALQIFPNNWNTATYGYRGVGLTIVGRWKSQRVAKPSSEDLDQLVFAPLLLAHGDSLQDLFSFLTFLPPAPCVFQATVSYKFTVLSDC